jgi:DNA-binding phage protein
MTISDRLQRLIASRGLSSAEVARRAGMERQQCWRVIAGDNDNPQIRTVERIVAAAGGTMVELFTDPPTD